MEVKIKKLNTAATVPTYGTEYSAGADLYSLAGENITVHPHKTVMVHTGIALEIPEGYAGLIFARSGLACKKGLAPANKVGVIDADYRGEIIVALHNHTENEISIDGGERVAQLSIVPFLKANFVLADELSDTVRGDGGFGSTGRK